jgi:hypothetical protein
MSSSVARASRVTPASTAPKEEERHTTTAPLNQMLPLHAALCSSRVLQGAALGIISAMQPITRPLRHVATAVIVAEVQQESEADQDDTVTSS